MYSSSMANLRPPAASRGAASGFPAGPGVATVTADARTRRTAPLMSGPSLPAAERFYQEALGRLQRLLDSQRDALDRAADLCTNAIAHDGLVHLFGCGHSRMLCEEMTP